MQMYVTLNLNEGSRIRTYEILYIYLCNLPKSVNYKWA